MNPWFVYILTNKSHRVLYTGSTDDPYRRTLEHQDKMLIGFTSKYNVNKLVYYEQHEDKAAALRREKQLKRYRRAWKEELINEMNPEWKDLKGDFEPKPG